MRQGGEAPEFLAIKPAGHDRWQLPKGRIDRGESSQAAAVREVREEGGVDAEIVAGLGPIRYFYRSSSRGVAKTVDFYLMRYTVGDTAAHDSEVDEACWPGVDDIERLTFETERDVVRKAWALLESGR